MSVTFAPVRMIEVPEQFRETTDPVGLLVPYVDESHPLAVNVHRANAAGILERLGLDPLADCGQLDGPDFLGRCLVANVGRDDSAVPAVTDDRWTEGGRRAAYYADVMARLADLATAVGDGQVGWVG